MKRKKRRQRKGRKPLTRTQKLAIAVIATLAAVVGGLTYGAYALRSWVVSLDTFRVTDACIVDVPEWLPASVESQLVRLYPVGEGVSIFDPELLHEVKARYSESTWVKNVEWVRKRFPNLVQCKMQLRKPAGAVHLKRYYVTDSDGVRLPGSYSRWPEVGFDLPAIEGVRGSVPLEGMKWPDPAVDAATAVLHATSSAGLAQRLHLKSVDVSNYIGRVSRKNSEIVLTTTEGTEILWGRPPGSNALGEKSTAKKVAELKEIAEKESLGGYEYIDLRFKPPLYVHRFD